VTLLEALLRRYQIRFDKVVATVLVGMAAIGIAVVLA
jgi:hypothetical protein